MIARLSEVFKALSKQNGTLKPSPTLAFLDSSMDSLAAAQCAPAAKGLTYPCFLNQRRVPVPVYLAMRTCCACLCFVLCTCCALRRPTGIRGAFVRSKGKVFCAGADLTWMRKTTR